MAFLSKAFRFTAVFLVLFIGVEIVTCEMPGSDCAIVLAADHQVSTSNASGNLATSVPRDQHSVPDKDCDNCICCCAHTIVVGHVVLLPGAVLTTAYQQDSVENPVSRSTSIEHPPQLS